MHAVNTLARNALKRRSIKALHLTRLSTSPAGDGIMGSIAREDATDIRERWKRVFNDKPRTDVAAARVEYDLPGFQYSDFTRTGKLGIWNLLKCLEIIRSHFEIRDTEVMSSARVDERDKLIEVVTSQRLDVFPDLYKEAALVQPMKVLLRPGHAGNTSVSIIVELTDAKTGKLYARNQRQLVGIDPVHRKAIPTDKFRAKLKELADPSAEPVIVPDWKPSTDAVTYKFQVQHTDTDHLYHNNQATYIRFCVNAAVNACNEGKLKNFTGDFLRYDVSSALIRYLGESFPGEELDVTLWEDNSDLDSLYFHILRSNKVIMTAKLTYFKPTSSKL